MTKTHIEHSASAGHTGLRGYTLPLTPDGRSSLVPPPPWHFSGRVVWIGYRADPVAAQAFLPPPLRLSSAEENAAVAFYEWQWCGDEGAELTDPAIGQFSECMIALDAWLGDEQVCRIPFAWVDAAVPLVRGWLQGMPKLPGTVAISRSYGIGRATAEQAAGSSFHAAMTSSEQRRITASVKLSHTADPPPLSLRPLIHTRYIPGWGSELPPQNDLVRSHVTDATTGPVWMGNANLSFSDGGTEDAALAPIAVGHGYVFTYAETLRPGGRVALEAD